MLETKYDRAVDEVDLVAHATNLLFMCVFLLADHQARNHGGVRGQCPPKFFCVPKYCCAQIKLF